MFARWRAAGLIGPTLITVLMLPVLVSLGNWQWHRKAWKEGLISRIETRRTASPVSYPEALSAFVKTGDVEYLHARVTGTYDFGREYYLYAPTDQAQGWHVFTLMRPDGGLPPIFINRGWVPDSLRDPAKRSAGQVPGPVTVAGLVRLPQMRGWFTPDNDLAGNRWYWRDLDSMAWGSAAPASLSEFSNDKRRAFAPFSLDADATPENPGGWPKGGTTEIHLPNSHLQYVVTWYGLALTLIGIFAVYARQRLKDADAAIAKH